jgi:hypothetical protein
MGRVSREAAKDAKRDGCWADADTQRNQGRERGRADAIGYRSWCLCVLSEAGVRTMSRVRGGMGLVSREAAKDAKKDGGWVGADTQRQQGREVGVACGSGNLRMGE